MEQGAWIFAYRRVSCVLLASGIFPGVFTVQVLCVFVLIHHYFRAAVWCLQERPKEASPLFSLPKSLIIIGQGIPIPNLVVMHPQHCLRTSILRNLHRLNHRLQLLLRNQLQHRQRLGPTPNM